MDCLFSTEKAVFSYRVAGICIQDGKVLLQKPDNDSGYAFPGGHAVFGETNAETLIREFREEIGADISVRELKWVGELFFPWGDRACHQICLYYLAELCSPDIPAQGSFWGREHIEGRDFRVKFYWIPLEELRSLEVYPTNAPGLMDKLSQGVQHFIYRE